MKVIRLLPFVVLIVLIGIGIYFALVFEKQLINQKYADFVKASSTKVLEDINKQSQGINGVENLAEISDEKLVSLEKLSADFKLSLSAEDQEFSDTNKVEGSESINTKLEELYTEAKETNENFDELLLDVKSTQDIEEVLGRLKDYNNSVNDFAAKYDELNKELTSFADSSNSMKI